MRKRRRQRVPSLVIADPRLQPLAGKSVSVADGAIGIAQGQAIEQLQEQIAEAIAEASTALGEPLTATLSLVHGLAEAAEIADLMAGNRGALVVTIRAQPGQSPRRRRWREREREK